MPPKKSKASPFVVSAGQFINRMLRRDSKGAFRGTGAKKEATLEATPAVTPFLEAIKEVAAKWNPDQERANAASSRGHKEASTDAADFSVFKDASGTYRWVASSSNAFEDRDREILSTKGLKADVERTDVLQPPYGDVNWWHVQDIKLGECDFRMLSGRTLIESGTFRNKELGEAFAAQAKGLGVSVEFVHPETEPKGGVFDTFAITKRAFLPLTAAANPLTALTVTKESNMATMEEKLKQLASLLPGGEAAVQALLGDTAKKEASAEQAGVKFKEGEPKVGEEQPASSEAGAVPPPTEEEMKAPMPDEPDGDEAAVPVGNAPGTVGALTPDEFSQVLAAALAPLMQALNVEGKMRDALAEMKAEVGKYTDEAKTKEAGVTTQVEELKTKLKEAEAKLADLTSEQPRAGGRPSLDPANVINTEGKKEAGVGPAQDPMLAQFDAFNEWFWKAQQGQTQQSVNPFTLQQAPTPAAGAPGPGVQ